MNIMFTMVTIMLFFLAGLYVTDKEIFGWQKVIDWVFIGFFGFTIIFHYIWRVFDAIPQR